MPGSWEQIFIEERLYKQIEEQTSYEAVIKTVDKALIPFREELVRDVSREDIERLLEIRIKRISRYDIEKQHKEIRTINRELKSVRTNLKDTVGFTISYLDGLLDKYGKSHERQTELTEFSEVSIRKVALTNLTVVYNRESGFLGHTIKLDNDKKDIAVSCSEYDRLFLIFSNGMYKIISVPDKLFVGHELEWFGTVESDQCFNMVYRDGVENMAYVKRFTTPKFILDKEYLLFPRHKRSKILLLALGQEKFARVSLVPSSRAKSNVVEIDFNEYLIKGTTAKGKRVSNRAVRRVVEATGMEKSETRNKNLSLPGIQTDTEEDAGDVAANDEPSDQ